MFFETGSWIALRAPGSGNVSLPSPDILASNSKRYLAIECKSIKLDYKYFQKKEIDELKEFAKKFGAEAWLGVRFPRIGWYFVRTEDTKDSGKMVMINLELAKEKGSTFEDLIL